ncbi:hypothetical protein DRO55_00235 [Candidatus Bathyarchaeota archaeon]|nr:MAG: hypothetical protein DRO55_00235 [Candidatus Bathyarchaeota archaeon]
MRRPLDADWKGFGEVALLVNAGFLHSISMDPLIPTTLGDGTAATPMKGDGWNVELYGLLRVDLKLSSRTGCLQSRVYRVKEEML